jgi:hypothetical protein
MMFPNEIVNSEVQRDRVLVRFKVFAVAQPFALKSLQFLPDSQERALYMARSKAFRETRSRFIRSPPHRTVAFTP